MPRHVASSQIKGDNLRLMQYMLSPRCILMGSARMADPGDGTQGSVSDQLRGPRREVRREEVGAVTHEQSAGHNDHDAVHAGGTAGVKSLPSIRL
jgi:hypothetical protein